MSRRELGRQWCDYLISWAKGTRRPLEKAPTREDLDFEQYTLPGTGWGGAVARDMAE